MGLRGDQCCGLGYENWGTGNSAHYNNSSYTVCHMLICNQEQTCVCLDGMSIECRVSSVLALLPSEWYYSDKPYYLESYLSPPLSLSPSPSLSLSQNTHYWHMHIFSPHISIVHITMFVIVSMVVDCPVGGKVWRPNNRCYGGAVCIVQCTTA